MKTRGYEETVILYRNIHIEHISIWYYSIIVYCYTIIPIENIPIGD